MSKCFLNDLVKAINRSLIDMEQLYVNPEIEWNAKDLNNIKRVIGILEIVKGVLNILGDE